MDEKAMQEYFDKMDIKELIGRYAIAFDTGDADGFAGCYTEDGTLELLGSITKGRTDLREIARLTKEHCPDAMHGTINHVIEVNGDKAHSRCQLFTFLARPEAVYTFVIGYYEDELVKVDGKWYFSYRNVILLHTEVMQTPVIRHYHTAVEEAMAAYVASKAS